MFRVSGLPVQWVLLLCRPVSQAQRHHSRVIKEVFSGGSGRRNSNTLPGSHWSRWCSGSLVHRHLPRGHWHDLLPPLHQHPHEDPGVRRGEHQQPGDRAEQGDSELQRGLHVPVHVVEQVQGLLHQHGRLQLQVVPWWMLWMCWQPVHQLWHQPEQVKQLWMSKIYFIKYFRCSDCPLLDEEDEEEISDEEMERLINMDFKEFEELENELEKEKSEVIPKAEKVWKIVLNYCLLEIRELVLVIII